MRDPAGAVSGRIFAFRDISSDRLVEEMKSEFVATVSHELRGPLTSIYGFAETLLREDVLFGEEERRTFLRYIASESERLTSIVDALLNVARVDTGDLQVDLAPTDVALGRLRGRAEASRSRRRTGTGSCSTSPRRRSRRRPTGQAASGPRRRSSTTPSSSRPTGEPSPWRRAGRTKPSRSRRRRGSRHSAVRAGADLQQVLPRRRHVVGHGRWGCSSRAASWRRWAGTSTVQSEEGKGSQFTFELPLAAAPAPVVRARRRGYSDRERDGRALDTRARDRRRGSDPAPLPGEPRGREDGSGRGEGRTDRARRGEADEPGRDPPRRDDARRSTAGASQSTCWTTRRRRTSRSSS